MALTRIDLKSRLLFIWFRGYLRNLTLSSSILEWSGLFFRQRIGAASRPFLKSEINTLSRELINGQTMEIDSQSSDSSCDEGLEVLCGAWLGTTFPIAGSKLKGFRRPFVKFSNFIF